MLLDAVSLVLYLADFISVFIQGHSQDFLKEFLKNSIELPEVGYGGAVPQPLRNFEYITY